MVVFDCKVSAEVNGVKANQKILAEQESNNIERDKWASKAEFLLSCIGLSVGIGNVWRFPYLAYENGGGAFLLAYTVMLIIVGKPHFYAELALGQFTSLGTMRVWRCIPIAKGLGIAMITMSIMVAIYYNVIMCYTLYYFAQSFRSELPWKYCHSWWGATEDCFIRNSNLPACVDLVNKSLEYKVDTIVDEENVFVHSLQNISACTNGSQTAAEQFWEIYVLKLTSGIEHIGIAKWDLTVTLFFCWIIVYLGIIKGIQSSGKVVYFTATFPYVILITLVIYGCTLPGAVEGIKYFFIPDWSKLLGIQVWRAAVEQLLYSLSLGWGCLIMYSSFNKFDNNIHSDAVLVSILDFVTSIMAGVVIFAVLGNLSQEMHIDISKVAKGGQGLAFVTYPEALARLPVSQLWSALFFFMLFLLAIDSEFSYLENFFTVIYDEYPHLVKWKVYITFGFCMLFFLLGIPCVTQGGQYILNLMDTYGGGQAAVIVATVEIIVLMWGYGAERFSDDLEFMMGFRPGIYWRVCWKYLSPVVLLFVLIYSLITHETIKYNKKEYPMWAEIVGWLLVMLSVAQIPIWAAVELYKNRKDWRRVFKPPPDWGPADPELLRQYQSRFKPSPVTPKIEGVVNIAMDPITNENS